MVTRREVLRWSAAAAATLLPGARASGRAPRRILLLGGTGFIGQHLVRRLIDDGARVVTFARGAAHAPAVEHVRGDVRDAQAVTRLIERRFDTVFHLAGASGQDASDGEENRATNRDGEVYEFDADGLLAVCVQHEMDHLAGKVFVEYLSPLKRDRIKTKMIKKTREEEAEAKRRQQRL